MNKKTVGFAYASSPIAVAKGYAKSGCWYLAIVRYNCEEAMPQEINDVVYAALDKETVIAAIPFTFGSGMEWDRYSMCTGD